MPTLITHLHPSARTRVQRLVLVAALALVAAACGGDDDTSATSSPLSEPTSEAADSAEDVVEVTVRASGIAFDTDRIEVRAGQTLRITFENEDDGIQHNLHVVAGAVDAKTEIESGPITQTLEVNIDEPGTYSFSCDVHPSMAGELVVT